MAMTQKDCIAVTTLLRWITGMPRSNGSLPTREEAMEAAAQLADRAHTAMSAGPDGADFRAVWPSEDIGRTQLALAAARDLATGVDRHLGTAGALTPPVASGRANAEQATTELLALAALVTDTAATPATDRGDGEPHEDRAADASVVEGNRTDHPGSARTPSRAGTR